MKRITNEKIDTPTGFRLYRMRRVAPSGREFGVALMFSHIELLRSRACIADELRAARGALADAMEVDA